MSYFEAILYSIPILVVIHLVGFFLQVRRQRKWSNAPIIDPLDAQSHAEAILQSLRERVGSLDYGIDELGYSAYKAAQASAFESQSQEDLELLIAQFHFLGYTIDIVPVDQLPEEIPGERIVINPMVKS